MTTHYPPSQVNGNRFVDYLNNKLQTSDKELAAKLNMFPPVVNRIRQNQYQLDTQLLLQLAMMTGDTIRDLRLLLGP